MKKLSIAILLAVASWALLAAPAGASQKMIKSATPLKAKGAKPPPQPDLKITSLGLDKDCRLKVKVKNQGKGGVRAADYAQGVLKLSLGGKPLEIPFKKLDPAGALRRSGGAATYTLDAALPRTITVKAKIDGKAKIAESDETNNLAQATLTPRCRRIKAPGSLSVAPAGSGRIETLPESMTALTPRGQIKTLKLVELTAKGRQVRVKLRRGGVGHLSLEERKAAKVTVSGAGQKDSATLAELDKAGAINTAKRAAIWATGITLAKPARITARLEFRGKVQLKSEKLAPARTEFSARAASSLRRAGGTSGEMKPKRMDLGFYISSPHEGEVFNPGGTMEVICGLYIGQPPVEEARLYLVKPGPGRRPIRIRTGPIEGYTRLSISIPRDIELGEDWTVYGEEVGVAEDERRWALSDPFAIRDPDGTAAPVSPTSGGIRVSYPVTGRMVLSNNCRVVWDFSEELPAGVSAPERATVILIFDDPRSATGWSEINVPISSSQREVDLSGYATLLRQHHGQSFTIKVVVGPASLPGGGVFLAEGYAGPMVMAPPRGFMEFVEPRPGTILRRGNGYRIQWRTNMPGRTQPSDWTWQLLRDGEPTRWSLRLSSFNYDEASGTFSFPWQVPNDVEPGEGCFQMRLSAAGNPWGGEPLVFNSGPMSVASTSYQVMIPWTTAGARAYWGLSYDILWTEIGDLGGRVNIYLKHLSGDRGRSGGRRPLATNLPVSQGRFTWNTRLMGTSRPPECGSYRIVVEGAGHPEAAGETFTFTMCMVGIAFDRSRNFTGLPLGNSVRLRWSYPGEGNDWRNLPWAIGRTLGFTLKLFRSGREVCTIHDAIPYNQTTYTWRVGDGCPGLSPGDNYRLRVELNGHNPIVFDQTHEFSILPRD